MNAAPSATQPWRTTIRWVRIASTVYALIVILATVLIKGFGDRWSIATLILFGPRWMISLPLVVLIPLAIHIHSWRMLAVLVLTGLFIAGPITGGTIHFTGALTTEKRSETDLRIMTWNMNSRPAPAAFRNFIDETNPDFLFCQEAILEAGDLPPGWTLLGEHGHQIATRRPIMEAGLMNFYDLAIGGYLMRYRTTLPTGELTLVNVHLPTVRPGIQTALNTRLRDLSVLRTTIDDRHSASQLARDWIGTPGSLILAGDFNMPVDSALYRSHWSAYRNAFSDAGLGWGTTKQTSWFGIRIDHILSTSNWRCRAVRVGPAMGSDHLPVIADLTYEGR